MEYKITGVELEYFPAWSGGEDTLKTLIEKGDCDAVEMLIEEIFFDKTPTDTEINDFLWFERDMIAEHLGYDDWEDYEYGKDEDDEEDDEDED